MHTIRWRLALPFIFLSILVIGSITWYTGYQMQVQIQNIETERLLAEGRVVADRMAMELSVNDSGEVQNLTKTFSQLLGLRITIISIDGKVIAESDTSPLFMENHLNRPEIAQAIQTGLPASDIRFSDTLLTRFLYTGIPIKYDGKLIGVARLAISLASIQNTQQVVNRNLVLMGILSVIVVFILAFFVSEYTVQPLRKITHAAEDFAMRSFKEPDLQGVLDRKDEIGILSRSIHKMGQELHIQLDELENEQEKLFAILTAMTDGVVIVDRIGRVSLINPAASLLFNISEPQAIGKSLTETIRNHQIVELWKESGEKAAQVAHTMELSANRTYIQVICTPLGEAVQNATLILFQDLTRIRRLETVRQDFVSNVSHELRTPMAAIKSLAETLEEGALEDPLAARRFLQLMQQEIDSMSQLVQEFLELSRIESGKVKVEKKPVRVEDMIRMAVGRMQNQAQRAGLSIRYEVGDIIEIVDMDSDRIQQVMLNLIHNAIKFTPPGGEVTIKAEPVSGFIKISVTDTGVGISELDLPRIFERFYKSDRARSGGGTGLGLSIARHLVEAHGGEIWAESQPGQGSTFSFTIPVG